MIANALRDDSQRKPRHFTECIALATIGSRVVENPYDLDAHQTLNKLYRNITLRNDERFKLRTHGAGVAKRNRRGTLFEREYPGKLMSPSR
jgi:hypothetical protein